MNDDKLAPPSERAANERHLANDDAHLRHRATPMPAIYEPFTLPIRYTRCYVCLIYRTEPKKYKVGKKVKLKRKNFGYA